MRAWCIVSLNNHRKAEIFAEGNPKFFGLIEGIYASTAKKKRQGKGIDPRSLAANAGQSRSLHLPKSNAVDSSTPSMAALMSPAYLICQSRADLFTGSVSPISDDRNQANDEYRFHGPFLFKSRSGSRARHDARGPQSRHRRITRRRLRLRLPAM
jgi:hypothetical protein